jgi:hypothetical protein
MLKAPGITHLKLKYNTQVSNFGFKFNLRRFIKGVSSAELNGSSGLGDGLLNHARCVIGMNSLKCIISPPDTAAHDAKVWRCRLTLSSPR